MCLSQGLLTWTLILAALTAPASCLPPVIGTDGGFAYLYGILSLPASRLVTWSFNGTLIVIKYKDNNPNYTTHYIGGRCELYSDTTLRLNNLTMADQGVYTLSVQNLDTSSTAEDQIELQVYRHLTTPTLYSSDSRPVSGNEVILHCDDHNQTVTSYTFYRNLQDVCSQKHVNCTGSYLIFQPIMEGDSGSYTCNIQNPISSNSSKALDLSVSVPVSEVKIQSNTSSSVTLWAGIDSLSLSCSADGNALHFSWNLNGVPLSSDSRYHYNQDKSIIIISPLDKKDNGTFTCTATNVLNSETSSDLKLNLYWHPDGDIKCYANGTGQTVHLFCSWPGGFPSADINMMFQSNIDIGEDQVMKSVSLSMIDSGDNMACHGTQGGLQRACTLSFGKPQVAEFPNHSEIKVEKGSSATLTVALTSNAGGVNSRALEPAHQILPATFTWFYFRPHSTPVPEGEKFNVNSTAYASSLTVNSVSENENGTYECTATNLFGTTSFNFLLLVPSKKVSGGLGPGQIAGIVIGVLTVLVLVGVVVFYIMSRKKNTPKAHLHENTDDQRPHTYETTIPRVNIMENPSSKEEHIYQGLIFQDKEIYSNQMPGPKT